MYLEKGTIGSDVAQLQRDLNFCGYDAGLIDADFGDNTESAVLELQREYGLEPDGIYGNLTDAVLMGIVKKIQQALVGKGYSIAVDGIVGNETLNATENFQANNGLNPDKIVGPLTLSKLGLGPAVPEPVTPNTPSIGSGDIGVFFSPSKQPDNIYIVSGISEQQYCEDLVANYIIPELQARGGRGYTYNEGGVLNGQRNAYCNQLYAEGIINYSIPIHTNAGGGQGCEVFCNPDGNSLGHRLSLNLLSNIVALGRPNRGLKDGDAHGLYEYYVDAPVAYIEIDYHDSVAGCNFLLNNRREIAIAFVNAIYAQ